MHCRMFNGIPGPHALWRRCSSKVSPGIADSPEVVVVGIALQHRCSMRSPWQWGLGSTDFLKQSVCALELGMGEPEGQLGSQKQLINIPHCFPEGSNGTNPSCHRGRCLVTQALLASFPIFSHHSLACIFWDHFQNKPTSTHILASGSASGRTQDMAGIGIQWEFAKS